MFSIIKIVLLKILPKNNIGDTILYYILFFYAHHRIPRRNSLLINDYLFYLKSSNWLYDPIRQFTSDKYFVKIFLSSIIEKKHIIETIEIIDHLDSIENLIYNVDVVIKPTHSAGNVVFLSKENNLNEESIIRIKSAFNENIYNKTREKNYRYLKPAIIVEPNILNNIKDYKVFCYKGEPRFIIVESERFSNHKRNVYDLNWNHINIAWNFPQGDIESCPKNIGKIIDLAAIISNYFESIRIDFFIKEEEVYVGELTHCHAQAHSKFMRVSDEVLISKLYFGINH